MKRRANKIAVTLTVIYFCALLWLYFSNAASDNATEFLLFILSNAFAYVLGLFTYDHTAQKRFEPADRSDPFGDEVDNWR